MLRVAVASLVSLLALPAAAHAALPAAHPPGRTVAGVRVTWPLKTAETLVAPGAKLTVKVRSSHRRAKLSLIRVDSRGVPLRALARRTVRSGSFNVALPGDEGASYQLRVVIAGKRYWSWVTTRCTVCHDGVRTTTPPPPPAPAPASLACDYFVGLPLPALELGGAVTPGTEFTYLVKGIGGTAFGGSWERRDAGGSWVPYPDGVVQPGTLKITSPGVSRTASLPASAPAGTYRLVESVSHSVAACADPTPQDVVGGPEIVVP